MPALKILVIPGSLRTGSLNAKLAAAAAQGLVRAGADVTRISLGDFPLPIYDGDVETTSGVPAGAQKLRERFLAADAFMISTPEYNLSIPGTLKNAIDWVSRVNPIVWRGKPGFLLSASPSMVGGNRGAWAARVPLEGTGAHIYPDMFSVVMAHQAFDEAGALKDPKMAARLDKTVAAFLATAQAIVASTRQV